MLSWFALAFAGEPTITVEDDGTVVCDIVVPATEAEVRSMLADPIAAGKLDPDVIDTRVTPRGPCVEITRTTRGAWDPLTLRSLRCPTTDGFTETLLESGDFSDFQSDWVLSPTDGGTRVRYKVRTDVNLPVPDSMIRQGVKKNVRETIRALLERVIPGLR